MKAGHRLWVPLLAWAISRGVVIGLWQFAEQVLPGDVSYYFDRMHRYLALGASVAQTMPEYPTPVLWLLTVPYVFSGQTSEGFLIAFVALLMALDLAFTLLLWQRGRGRGAVWFWIGFVVAIGPIAYLRLDLVTSVAVGVALIALSRGADRLSGVLLALGAGLKLWPGTLWPTTVQGNRRRDHLVTVSFFLTGAVMVVLAVLQGGVGRLVSPLAWQSGRGLQIESVWATPAMLARVFAPQDYRVEFSRWQAFEIFGPGVEQWLTVSSVMTYLGYLATVVAYVLWFRSRYPAAFGRPPRLVNAVEPASPASIGLFMVAVITLTLITNKTFSPQYLVWLGATVAALLLLAGPEDPWIAKTAKVAAFGVLGLAFATQLIYPIWYDPLIGYVDEPGFATVLLAARNGGLVVLGGWVFVRFWPVLLGRGAVASNPVSEVSAGL
jgi:hypothetical protein